MSGALSRLVAVVAAAVALLLAGSGALAFFTSAGAGAGSATTGTLAAPAAPTVPASVTGTDVTVSWSGVTPPVASEAAAYWVRRWAGAAAADACGSSAAAPILPGAGPKSCTDTNVLTGSYTYTVTALWRSWAAASPNSATVAVSNDATGPSLDVTFPAAGAVYGTAGWNAGCTSSVCGTASDPSGVAGVAVSVRQGTGSYWTGTSFSSPSEVLHAASGTTSWSLPFAGSAFPADGGYTVRAVATDGAGNTTSVSRSFTIDTTAPAVTVTSPTAGAVVTTTTPALAGAAGNATGDSATVTVRIYAGTGTGGALLQTIPVTRSAGAWSTAAGALATGTYTVQATQTDAAGNTGTSGAVTFSVPAFAPTAVTLGGGNGVVAKDDSMSITYSRTVNAASMCSLWTGTGNQSLGSNDTVVVTITNSGANDVLTVTAGTCTLNIGSVALGGDYVSATKTFSGNGSNASTVGWNPTTRTLLITLGSTAAGSTNTGVAAGTPVYTPSGSITDSNGNAISAAPFNAPSTSRF